MTGICYTGKPRPPHIYNPHQQRSSSHTLTSTHTTTRTEPSNEREVRYPRSPRGTLPREPRDHTLSSMVEGGFLVGAGGIAHKCTERPELCGNKAYAGVHPPHGKHLLTHHRARTGSDVPGDGLVTGNGTYLRGRTGFLPGWCRVSFQPSSRGCT